jgi:hypothetical protein
MALIEKNKCLLKLPAEGCAMGLQDRDYMRNRRNEKPENSKISKVIHSARNVSANQATRLPENSKISNVIHSAALKIWKVLWITLITIGAISVVALIIGANLKSSKPTSPSPNASDLNSSSQKKSQTDKEEAAPSKSSSNNKAFTIITEEKFKTVSPLPNALRLQLDPSNFQFIAVKYKRTSANDITLKSEEFEWVLIEDETSKQYIKISPDLWKILGPFYPNLNLSNPSNYVK